MKQHILLFISRIVAPFPRFFFLRGRGRGQSVHLQPRITDLSWADFNFIWTSQSQRAHVTLHLCFWISFERYVARAFFSWKKEHPRNVCFFPSFSTHILIKLPFTRLVALHNFFQNFLWTPQKASYSSITTTQRTTRSIFSLPRSLI